MSKGKKRQRGDRPRTRARHKSYCPRVELAKAIGQPGPGYRDMDELIGLMHVIQEEDEEDENFIPNKLMLCGLFMDT